MNQHPAATADLQAVLAAALDEHFSLPRSINELVRRPSANQSSYALEELDILLDDDSTLQLLFKDLSPAALLDQARRAKPAQLYDPRREIEVYRTILPSAGLGTAVCYGATADPDAGRFWLFLERVAGLELDKIGELATWREAARWLTGFHARFASPLERLARAARLLNYNADFYRFWMRRARAIEPALDDLARVYSRVIEKLLSLPATVIHGEFYASNVLVKIDANGVRVCPVDWEMAAVGPALMDLAALTAGRWSEDERKDLASAYWQATRAGAESPVPGDDFFEELDYCRLHQAVQWLGWSAEWSPPVEHAHDWLREALTLAGKLRLLDAPAANGSRPTPRRRLIVNADDFGQSPGVNRGIIVAYESGIVTSASLMVRWPAAADAAVYAREHPALSVGLHFDLGEWAWQDGSWICLYQVVPLDDSDAVRAELQRQLDVFRQLMDREPTHFDSHQHVHRQEPVRRIVTEIAGELRVPVRHFTEGVEYCGGFYGQGRTGEPNLHAVGVDGLLAILAALHPGATELGCHPGLANDVDSMYRGERAEEVTTLCDPRVRAFLAEAGIELFSFHTVAGASR